MGRHYKPNGEYAERGYKGKKYPSVTSVLEVIAKPQLLMWYGKHGTTECRRILKESADKGTAVHSAIERHLFGDPAGWDDPLAAPYRAGAEAAIRNLELEKATKLDTEVTVVNEVDGYAGTFDLLATFEGGKSILVDWKSGKSLYPEFAVQMAAYAHAFTLNSDTSQPIKDLVCCRVGLDGEFEVKRYENSQDLFEIFLAALRIYNWKSELTKKED